MNKNISSVIILACSTPLQAGDLNISGDWNCHLKSEYVEQDFNLNLKQDGAYEKKTEMFGNIHLDKGNWRLEAKTLILSRTENIKNGKSKPSSQEFKREVETSDSSLLVLKNNNSTSICKK